MCMYSSTYYGVDLDLHVCTDTAVHRNIHSAYAVCACTVDLLLPHSLVLQVTHIQLFYLIPGLKKGEPGYEANTAAICTHLH